MQTIGPYPISEARVIEKTFHKAYKMLLKTDFPGRAKVNPPSEPKVLGKGTKGVAYDAGSKVIKITSDASEASAAATIAGKKLEGVYYVYGVYQMRPQDLPKEMQTFRDKQWTEYYFIVQEKLGPQKGGVATKFFLRTDEFLWQVYKSNSEVLIDSFGWGDKHYKAWKEWAAKRKVSKEVMQVAEGMRSLKKEGISFSDLSDDNIMKGPRGHVIIDLGYSGSTGGKIVELKWKGNS